ncbi:MAG: hypothetical protein ACLUTT_02495 [Ruminococcus sp.]
MAVRHCIKENYLLALPTPTTFEKVDQTFNFGQKIFLSLNFVVRPKVG